MVVVVRVPVAIGRICNSTVTIARFKLVVVIVVRGVVVYVMVMVTGFVAVVVVV